MTFQLYARVETGSVVWIVGRAGLSRIFQFLMLWRRLSRLPGSDGEPKWVSSVLTIQTSKSLFMLNRTPIDSTPLTSLLRSRTNFYRQFKMEPNSSSASTDEAIARWMQNPYGERSCDLPGTGVSRVWYS